MHNFTPTIKDFMKTLIALAFLFTSTAHAFVPTALHCKELHSGIDNGYEAIFNVQMTKVSISEQTIAGPRHLTLLNCGAEDTLVNCSEPKLRDAGYSMSLVEADGMKIAKLYEVTFGGAKHLADLACRYLNPQR